MLRTPATGVPVPSAAMADRFSALVDRAWPWVAIASAALAALVVVVAFATQPGRRDDDKVRDTLTDFVDAATNRDGQAACDLLSAHGRQVSASLVPGVPCASYARSFGFDVAGLGGVTLTLPAALPDRVVLDQANMRGPDGQPVGRRVELVRVHGDFRIDAIGRS
jgi:hypothetical protein